MIRSGCIVRCKKVTQLSSIDDKHDGWVAMSDAQREQTLDETGQHPLYGGLEQRRAFPRIKLRIPVQIGLPGGQVACARIYNLSPDGIQIRCDPNTAQRIHPSGRIISDGSGPKILIALRLNQGADMRTHVLKCRVFYLLPEASQEVIIGLEFEELNAAQRDLIDSLMSASLEPQD